MSGRDPVAMEAEVMRWLEVCRAAHLPGGRASPATALLNGAIDSLALLDLIAACEVALEIRIPLARIGLDDLETVAAFAQAVARVSEPDTARTWTEIPLPQPGARGEVAMLMRLRAHLPAGVLVRVRRDAVALGVPDDLARQHPDLIERARELLRATAG
ncbi:MAG: acyl carrier protein [Pseudomonadota bacterium]